MLPNVEKMVCVTNIDGLDETQGSANHLDGAPLKVMVSGPWLPLLEYPKAKSGQLQTRAYCGTA